MPLTNGPIICELGKSLGSLRKTSWVLQLRCCTTMPCSVFVRLDSSSEACSASMSSLKEVALVSTLLTSPELVKSSSNSSLSHLQVNTDLSSIYYRLSFDVRSILCYLFSKMLTLTIIPRLSTNPTDIDEGCFAVQWTIGRTSFPTKHVDLVLGNHNTSLKPNGI